MSSIGKVTCLIPRGALPSPANKEGQDPRARKDVNGTSWLLIEANQHHDTLLHICTPSKDKIRHELYGH
jgi:hypothetical protein